LPRRLPTGRGAPRSEVAPERLIASARALEHSARTSSAELEHFVALLRGCRGCVVVTGVGPSGALAALVCALLNRHGLRSCFLHAGDAAHGDLGVVMARDLVLLVSDSGETEELVRLLPYLSEIGAPVAAFVGRRSSPLARAVRVALCTDDGMGDGGGRLALSHFSLVCLAFAQALAEAAAHGDLTSPRCNGKDSWSR
jgi:arabinose-5-phosphate isomerase